MYNWRICVLLKSGRDITMDINNSIDDVDHMNDYIATLFQEEGFVKFMNRDNIMTSIRGADVSSFELELIKEDEGE